MDEKQFRELNGKLDKLEEAICGNEYDPTNKPGLIRIVLKHDAVLFGENGKPGLLQNVQTWNDREQDIKKVKTLVTTIGVGALSVAALIEIISKLAEWTSSKRP